MKSIVILSAHYRVRMMFYLFILSSYAINYILADSGEHESAALHSFPGAIKRSSAYVTGCHCNCTSNNNDDLSNIGFFPCQSFGCIQCAPTNYDVCVSAYTDSEGNQQYGMHVCLTDQQQATAMCLYSLQIPYFICEKTDNQYIECQYERGNEESLCTFRAPTKTIADGCYPLAPSCPADSSRVCCENAQDCTCLSNIYAPSSNICLQKSVANSLWGSCECDANTYNGSPVCGACGECDDDDEDDDSPSDGTNTVSGSTPKDGGGGGNIGGFEESHQDPIKIAGVVVPIVAIIIFLVVGLLVIWRSGGIPKCMRRGCNCEETGSMTELPVKRPSRGPDQQNPYEIESNDEPHFYAGVHNIDNTNRAEQDGPLTNAQEDTNGYLWYRGEGSSQKKSLNLDQNKKDPGDGLVYYELEETKEKMEDKTATDPTPDYLEFDVDGKPEPNEEETQPQEKVKSTEQPESQANPAVDVAEGGSHYGKLDRSPNKTGHLKSHSDPPEDDQYGHLEPVKNDAADTPGCPPAAQTYESLDRSQMKPLDENLNVESAAEYGQLDMAEAEQHTAPPNVAPVPETAESTRIRSPDDMPPSSEEVYGIL